MGGLSVVMCSAEQYHMRPSSMATVLTTAHENFYDRIQAMVSQDAFRKPQAGRVRESPMPSEAGEQRPQ